MYCPHLLYLVFLPLLCIPAHSPASAASFPSPASKPALPLHVQAGGVCKLCIREKYFIMYKPKLATINDKNEIGGPRLHKRGQILRNI